MTAAVAEPQRSTEARPIGEILAPQDASDVFPEVALSLFTFEVLLLRRLRELGVRDVFFLSREGQLLKQLFDRLLVASGETGIRSHYLEVSRRSTFLLSLGPTATESFQTLFRQYRAISMYEFLSSLSLEGLAPLAGEVLGISQEEVRRRRADLPTDPLFTALITNARFRQAYESARLDRRSAFSAYVQSLAGGRALNELVVVDVGWKGTIQDNLFNILRHDRNAPFKAVRGIYLGLTAPGSRHEESPKEWILFNCVFGRSPHSRTFAENLSLFEILLAANHGSVCSYATGPDGLAKPVRDPFEEEHLVRSKVQPIQRRIISRFDEIAAGGLMQARAADLLAQAATAHQRMVFRPSEPERRWFANVFHVENFGVFERSTFQGQSMSPTLLQRLRFSLSLLRRRGRAQLGFWPYATVRGSGGALPATLYAAARRLQDRISRRASS